MVDHETGGAVQKSVTEKTWCVGRARGTLRYDLHPGTIVAFFETCNLCSNLE